MDSDSQKVNKNFCLGKESVTKVIGEKHKDKSVKRKVRRKEIEGIREGMRVEIWGGISRI